MSRYAQVIAYAREALASGQVLVHIPIHKAASMERAKSIARSFQMNFSAFRADQRKTMARRTGNPEARTEWDNVTSRVLPHPDGDGYIWEVYRTDRGGFGEFETLDPVTMQPKPAPEVKKVAMSQSEIDAYYTLLETKVKADWTAEDHALEARFNAAMDGFKPPVVEERKGNDAFAFDEEAAEERKAEEEPYVPPPPPEFPF